MAFDSLEPFGDERADLRIAQLSALVANAWSGEGDRPLGVLDFMPFLHEGPVGQTAETQGAILKSIGETMRKDD